VKREIAFYAIVPREGTARSPMSALSLTAPSGGLAGAVAD